MELRLILLSQRVCVGVKAVNVVGRGRLAGGKVGGGGSCGVVGVGVAVRVGVHVFAREGGGYVP